jgi:tRNA nucleotidyltransferase (CCA-adding enzyme)
MAALLHGLGEEGANEVLQELRCSNALRNRVLLLIKLSPTPLTADKKQLFQLLGEHGQEAVKQLLALQIAMAKVSGEDLAELNAVSPLLETLCLEGSCLTVKELAITGTDLLELGAEPGPQIGRCMQFLLSLVQDEIIANTKEELLAAAKNFFETEEEK